MGQIKKELKGKVVFKHEKEADWNKSEYIPSEGEKVLYDPDDGCSYTRMKFGDGEHRVVDLPFSPPSTNGISEKTHAEGNNTLAGSKAYYYKAIDFENKKIYLSESQGLDKPREYVYSGTHYEDEDGYIVLQPYENGNNIIINSASTESYIRAAWIDPNAIVGEHKDFDVLILMLHDKTGLTGSTVFPSVVFTPLIDGVVSFTLSNNFGANSFNLIVSSNLGKTYEFYWEAYNSENIISFPVTAGETYTIVIDEDSYWYEEYYYDYPRVYINNFFIEQEKLDINFPTPDWAIGDYVTLDNSSKYDKCAQITAINHNEITLDKLPFTEIVPLTDLDFDDYSILNVSQPTKGIIDFGKYSHAEGNSSKAIGYESHAEGYDTKAYGRASHTEGYKTEAVYAAHAEGKQTRALGLHSHTEGYLTEANTSCAHAEGRETIASAYAAHAEGHSTQAKGASSHAEGQTTFAEGKGSHAEGSFDKSIVYDNGEIIYNIAKGEGAHVEGRSNLALKDSSHAEGKATTADGASAHAEGYKTKALNTNTHAEGRETTAEGYAAHAEGHTTYSKGESTHTEGKETYAHGIASHAEGYQTKAYGTAGHAEGNATFAGSYNRNITNTDGKTVAYTANTIVNYTHAEGTGTKALGTAAHAEGGSNIAIGNYAHAEGQNTKTYANQAHAEGYQTTAKGGASHAEGGYTLASSNYSHAGGKGTIASAEAQTAIGKYNEENADALFIVGKGPSDTNRSNAFEVISTSSGCSIKIGNTTLTEAQLKKLVAFLDTIEG